MVTGMTIQTPPISQNGGKGQRKAAVFRILPTDRTAPNRAQGSISVSGYFFFDVDVFMFIS